MENDVRFLKAEVSRVHCRIVFSEETGEVSGTHKLHANLC